MSCKDCKNWDPFQGFRSGFCKRMNSKDDGDADDSDSLAVGVGVVNGEYVSGAVITGKDFECSMFVMKVINKHNI